jgi:hypothetical protein
METALKPVHDGRGRKRRWPAEQKLAEAFFGSFKGDYVYQPCLETLALVRCQVPQWIEHYNQQAPP